MTNLTDSQIDRLARLMLPITRMDRTGRFCNMEENGTTLNVARHYCASCAEEAIQAEAIRYYAHQACTYTEYLEAIRQIEAQAGYGGRHDS